MDAKKKAAKKTERVGPLMTFAERDAAVSELRARGYSVEVTCWGGQFFTIVGKAAQS